MELIKNVQLRTVINWQLIYSVVIAIIFGITSGFHGAISGFLGALISAGAASAYAVVISRHKGFTASGTLRTALRAELLKVFIIIVALWAVLENYQNVKPVIFICSFIGAVIMSSMALFVPSKTAMLNNNVRNGK
ncbi:MAG TPA: ATP synthase subunit I [Nitrosomonas mobilis]|nr:ATP synthase subunit I [Nitrosomonas mobilis]